MMVDLGLGLGLKINSADPKGGSQNATLLLGISSLKIPNSLWARGVSVCIRCTLSYSLVSDRGEPEVLENRG